jgi:hypothetical protein
VYLDQSLDYLVLKILLVLSMGFQVDLLQWVLELVLELVQLTKPDCRQ